MKFWVIFVVSVFCGAAVFAEEPRIAPSAEAAKSQHSLNFQNLPVEVALDLYRELTGRTVWIHPKQHSFQLTLKTEKVEATEAIRKMEAAFAAKKMTFTEGPAGLLVFHPDDVKIEMPKKALGTPAKKENTSFANLNLKRFLDHYNKLTAEEVRVKANPVGKLPTISLNMSGASKDAIQQMEAVLRLNGIGLKKEGDDIHVDLPPAMVEKAKAQAAPAVAKHAHPHRAGDKHGKANEDKVREIIRMLRERQMNERNKLPLLPPQPPPFFPPEGPGQPGQEGS